MMEAIAGAAMDMKSAQLAAEYSIAVTKKVMDRTRRLFSTSQKTEANPA